MQVCMSLRLLCHDLSAGSSTKQHSTAQHVYFFFVVFCLFGFLYLFYHFLHHIGDLN